MNNEEAIGILKEELHHTEFHLQDKNKAPEFYEEMGRYCEALKMAINALIDKKAMENFIEDIGRGRIQMKNYIDKKGNYINCENLSLRAIYDRGIDEGRALIEEERLLDKDDGRLPGRARE